MRRHGFAIAQLLRVSAGLIVWSSAFVFLYAGSYLGCRALAAGAARGRGRSAGQRPLQARRRGVGSDQRHCGRGDDRFSVTDGAAVSAVVRLFVLSALSTPAAAHGPAELAFDWMFWLLLAAGVAYGAGLARSRHRPAWYRPLLFAAGWLLLAAALAGPVEHWADASLAGHMTQHMLLLAVVPPLLLLARPLPYCMLALPVALRRRIGPAIARGYTAAGATPVSAFLVHGLVIWLWHLPTPYQAALRHDLLHDLEHVLFFGTGLWFWWSLIAPGRLGRPGFGPAAVLAVLTLMHTGMLGAMMTFAPQLIYPGHPAGFAGLDQLSDQQLAGLIMWVPGGFIYSAAALALTVFWLRESERGAAP